MASGITCADNSRENHRWGDSNKVYTRRKLKDDATSTAAATAAGNSLPLVSRVKNRVRINLENLFPKDDVRILKRKLICELDQIRNLVNQIEAKEIQLFEKEKRTPKANQYYSSEFLLAKDRLPPGRNNKSKSSKKRYKQQRKGSLGFIHIDNKLLKSCNNLLAKLSKHKYGWVFENPVDVKALGLHDYHNVIKQPMDLGTIKNKLAKNRYKSSLEFAEDVRLTFSNAMTYNPIGQDVHVMAEELLKIFEEKYAELEVLLLKYSRTLDMSESINWSGSIGKAPDPALATKRPRAKDLNKRDMTYEEKQKLSTKLQGLPVDKLDGIVQIIKKRNTQLSQHDDEIEVDIDSVDAETLWELDRFVTNYKKTLSKSRRRDQAKADPTRASTGDVADTAGETEIVAQGDNVVRSSGSSSESSSSRDSDSDGSSDGSDERRELKLT